MWAGGSRPCKFGNIAYVHSFVVWELSMSSGAVDSIKDACQIGSS